MRIYDGLLKAGQNRYLRPFTSFLVSSAARLPFHFLLTIVGRRLVTASAASPAILLSGSNLEETPRDARLLYEAMRYTVESMHLDTFCMMADLSVKAEACGCPVIFEKMKVPSIQSHIINTIEDIRNLKQPDPCKDGRMPIFLECMRMLKRNHTGLKNRMYYRACHPGSESARSWAVYRCHKESGHGKNPAGFHGKYINQVCPGNGERRHGYDNDCRTRLFAAFTETFYRIRVTSVKKDDELS